MKLLDRLFYALMLVVTGFAIAAIVLEALNERTNQTLVDAGRYNVALECGQTLEQLSRFGQILGFYLIDRSEARRRELEIVTQILEGRSHSFNSGTLEAYAASTPERGSLVRQYQNATASIVAGTILRGASWNPVGDLDKSHKLLSRMCADTQEYSSDAIEEARGRLLHNNKTALLLMIGLVVSGLSLVLLLGIQNRLARRGYAMLQLTSERYERLAKRDPLTGLPNRDEFLQALSDAFGRVRHGNQIAVITFDLDRFKFVNDSLGHGGGDQLLQSVANRLTETTLSNDDILVSRMGGDEFVVLMEGRSHVELKARRMAQRILDSLKRPHELGGHKVTVYATGGLALAPAHATIASELVRMSDTALYSAKKNERGSWRMYEPWMDADLKLRQSLELELQGALERDELFFQYQPFVDLKTGRIRGVEALLRWSHPTRGMISPGTFIPLAEDSGLIVHIGETMIRRACQDALRMPEAWQVAINLSTVQFLRGDIVATTEAALAESGLLPSRLELEITESVMIENDDRTRDVLLSLKKLGARIALDDFGTGYSSLSYLRRFAFDKLKIDRSFIQEIPFDQQSVQIVQSIVSLARTLGMTVTVEGIERKEQCPILLSAGCLQGQGYLFSRPIPLTQLLDWAKRQNHPADAAIAS